MTSNLIHGYEWPLGAEVTLLIDDPSNGTPVDYSDAQTVVVADWDPGQTWVQFVVPESFDIQPGHIVTLTHDTTTKIHTVTNLAMTSVDPDTDIVSGNADPDDAIHVWAFDDTGSSLRNVEADGTTGDWFADFSVAGGEPEQEIFDIGPGTNVDAYEWDDDGDSTSVFWRVPNPYFWVSPVDDRVDGIDWPVGEECTLTIDDPGTGPGADYTDSQTVTSDEWGNTYLNFEFWEIFDVEPGDIVTLTCGDITKTHTVTNLTVAGADPDTDIATGTADPGTDVHVGVCDDTGCSDRNVEADGTTGDWNADFSVAGGVPGQEIFDIVPGSQGDANQWDEDGDGTLIPWRAPNPQFNVMPAVDLVDGVEWLEGAEVTLLIDIPGIGSPVDYSDSQIAGPVDWDPQQIGVSFDFQGVFDVEPGHVVTLIQGTTTKTHTVTNLAVTGADADTNIVTGTADTETAVEVDICDETGCSFRNVEADGTTGDWLADFSVAGGEPGQEIFDIVPGSQGNAHQRDEDGDGTHIPWRVPNPHFTVWVADDRVQGAEWPLGAEVTLLINDPAVPGTPVDYSDAQTVVVAPWDPEQTSVAFDLNGAFDVQPDHIVTLMHGTTTKIHTVTNLTMTDVDPSTDTVSGTAESATEVWVQVHDEFGTQRHEVVDSSGDWSANFLVPGDEDFEQGTSDIVPGSSGRAIQQDDDGDYTQVDWRVPDPRFEVFPIDDHVEGYDWPEGALVTLTIDDSVTPEPVDYTDSQIVTSDPWGNTWCNFQFWGIFDVEPGDEVVLTDGVTTKTHTVTNLTVTGVDADTDIVSGTADPDASIDVYICDKTGCSFRNVAADGTTGDWFADFSVAGDEPGQEVFDIVPGSESESGQRDPDGDTTNIRWRVPDPRFSVTSLDDWVNGNGWPSGAEVTLTIDDPGTGPGVDYTESGTANPWGDFNFYLGGTFDVEPGHEVTLTDGVTTKVHTVTSLAVTDADSDTDTISGTADPGTDVELHICDETGCVYRYEVAEESGDWTADFSTPGDKPGEESTFDLVPGSQGQARRYDDDGDATRIYWRVPNPRFTVALSWNQVYGNDWLAGALATLTIDDPGTPEPVDYTDSQLVTSNPWNTWVSFNLGESFELQPGHEVTLTDAVTTKEHIVPNLVVTDVDPDTDTVSGTAEPGAQVDVYSLGYPSFAYRQETAGSGDWTADFSTPGGEPGEDDIVDIVPGTSGQAQHEQDSDGDYTYVNWYVPNPRIYVWPDDDRVDVYDFAPGELATLTIDDPDTGPGVDYTDSQTGTPSGPAGYAYVYFDLWGIFDLQAGHVVTLTDGVITKTHTVADLAVTSADPDTGIVSGTADPDAEVEVWAHLWTAGEENEIHAYRHEVADEFGDWTVDFSTPGDELGEENTFDLVPDTQGTAAQQDADDDATHISWRDYPDGDGIPNALDPDDDNDGFDDDIEAYLGTDPLMACALTSAANDEDPDPWPPDFDDNQIINILDVDKVLPPVFGLNSSDPGWKPRRDLKVDGFINILDVSQVLPPVFGTSCTP